VGAVTNETLVSAEPTPHPASGRMAWLGRPRLRPLWSWAIQLVLLVVCLFFQGLNTPHGLVTLSLPSGAMAKLFGFADSGSYLQAAQNLIANGRSTPEMIWLDGLSIRVSPFPFGVTIALINVLAWSAPFAILAFPFMRNLRSTLILVAVEFAILALPPFQSWMFDEGLFYADGLAAAMFLLALVLLANRLLNPASIQTSARDGIFVGIALAAAVYLRASYQLVPWVLGAVLAVLCVVLLLRRIRRRPGSRGLVREVLMLGVAVVSVLLLLQPYALYVSQTRHRLAFVATEELVYRDAWQDPSTGKVDQWLIDAGAPLGCELDLTACKQINRQVASGSSPSSDVLRDDLIKAIIAHPLEFVGNRVYYVLHQWFGDELASYSHVATDEAAYASGKGVSYGSSDNLNPPEGLLFLALAIAAFASAIVLAWRRRQLSMLIIPLSFLALLAPFAIVHVEVRYLIPLKLIGLLAPVLLIAVSDSPRRKRSKEQLDTSFI
jgi:hypothetical protein